MRSDLVILGGGYPGSLMATVASAMGYDVVLIDRDAQPRFSIGESTTPEQNTLHSEMAKRFNVPELANLGSYEQMRRGTRVPVWPKESFYFAQWDSPGQSAPNETLFQTTPWPIGPDYHCYRADYDLHILKTATARGVRLFAPAVLEDLELGEHGVSCTIVQDERRTALEASLLIDATGFGSALANGWQTATVNRSDVPLASRSIFSHFLDVRSVEEAFGNAGLGSLPLSRNHATAHFLLDHGWFWSIPFDNGITSVGVTLDCARHPIHDSLTPKEEFYRYVETVPAMSRLLENASPLREFTRTGQIQFCLDKASGPGWVALPPASGSVDPLMSPGNALVSKAVARLASLLPELLQTTNREPLLEQFGCLQRLEWSYTNRLQQSLYRSFSRSELFRPTFTLYQMASVLGAATGLGREHYRSPFDVPIWSFDLPEIRDAVDRFDELLAPQGKDNAPPCDPADLEQALIDADRHGYLTSPVNQSGRPGIHLINLGHARWISSLAPAGRRPWRETWWWRGISLVGKWVSRGRTAASGGSRKTSPGVSWLRHLRIILSTKAP
ncbi:MAG: FADH2 O2-dependent halogenase [Hyphomicrobiaceae bacterium]|jgi:FADH2 O2-dependent halogenase